MRRPPTWSTRLARAALIALVPLTMFVQAAFAHSSPVYQTFRNGVTLTSFSGTFEVIWPSQIYVAGAEIELRDEVNSRLLQATEGTAVEADVPCPEYGDRYGCARIRLTDIPVLAPGSYVMYWRVVHFDEYIEQRTIRFTIDPAWVPPTPTPSVSPTPTPTPSATAIPSATPSATPAPTLGPSPASSDTPAPSTASPDSSPSASPEVSPSGQPTPSPSGGGAGGDEDPQPNLVFAAVAALLLLSAAALGFARRRRGGRATPPRQD